MFCVFIAVYLILATTQVVPVHTANCECGKQSENLLSLRIVGGKPVDPHSHPWAVAILLSGTLHCGGALVTDRHVLSAGHCYKWEDTTEMVVLIGLDRLDNLTSVEKRHISKAIVHENFRSSEVRDVNDIAIVNLDKPVKFSDFISPICLPKKNANFGGWMSTVLGWGRRSKKGSTSNSLLEAKLKILSHETCLKSKLAEHLVEPTMMCAFSPGKDGCQGDSGGPLLVLDSNGKYVQTGIVSWGVGCADPRFPGVYTRVSTYVDWIKAKIADGDKCTK